MLVTCFREDSEVIATIRSVAPSIGKGDVTRVSEHHRTEDARIVGQCRVRPNALQGRPVIVRCVYLLSTDQIENVG